jgi:hypothetical protein
MNSHTLQKTDRQGNHATTYEKEPKPNPKFLGETIHEILTKNYPEVFLSKYKVNYTYDKEWFDHETKMRKDAGILDFQDSTPTEFMGFAQDGPAVDMYGFPTTGDDDDRYVADNGYDHKQFGEDE